MTIAACSVLISPIFSTIFNSEVVIQYSILCQQEKKKAWNDYISNVVLIQSIFLFAYLSLESWRSVASHEWQFVFGE